MGTTEDAAVAALRGEVVEIRNALEGISAQLRQLTSTQSAAGLEGPPAPTGPHIPYRRVEPLEEGVTGTTAPTGPHVPHASWRTADASGVNLTLANGSPVKLSPNSRWVMVDGLLVVF